MAKVLLIITPKPRLSTTILCLNVPPSPPPPPPPLDAGDEVLYLPSRTPHGLLSITFSQEKMLNIIRALDSNKSSGWDGVSPRMICDSFIVNPPLIHKKESKILKENYRPISLLPILGKMFEKVQFDSLYDYFIILAYLVLLKVTRVLINFLQ